MAVEEIEVKFRAYTSFTYSAGQKMMLPWKSNGALLAEGKIVYVFRTSRYGDVYHYATHKITKEDKKYSVPYKDFGQKVKGFFVVSDFSFDKTYIEVLRRRIKKALDTNKVLIYALNENSRYTYGDLYKTRDEWKYSRDQFVKDHVIYDEKDSCNYVYVYDYKEILTYFRKAFDNKLKNYNEFSGGTDSVVRQKYGDKYLEKRELGELIKGVAANLNKWDMLEYKGQELKDFLKYMDDRRDSQFRALDMAAQFIVTWLRSPGFSSYIEDHDFRAHDKDTQPFLLSIIDDIPNTPAGSTFTIQEILKVIDDYMKIKNQDHLKDAGDVTSEELSKCIDSDIKYSSILSLLTKATKTSDANFLRLSEVLAKVYYTQSVGLDVKESLLEIVIKSKINLQITFKSEDIIKLYGPQNCFVVDPSGGTKYASVRIIDLKKANWTDSVIKHRDVFSNIEAALIMIDFAICMATLGDILNDKSAPLDKKLLAYSAFAKSSADLLRVVVLKKISAKIAEGAAKDMIEVASKTLVWISAIIDVARYGYKTYDDIQKMDYDGACGSAMITLGSVGIGLVTTGIISSETGWGLIILIVGIILVVAGSIMKIFCDDDTVDDYLKESQWGKYDREKKKNYDNCKKQVERFYRLALQYKVTIKYYKYGKRPIFFGSPNNLRVIDIYLEPTFMTPLTALKLKLELTGGKGAPVKIWDDYVKEKDHADVVRETEDGKKKIGFVNIYFCDQVQKPNLEDFQWLFGSAEMSGGYFTYDAINTRYGKMIPVGGLVDKLDKQGYNHAKLTLTIDLNGDGNIVVELNPISEEITIDDFDLENAKQSYIMSQGMQGGFGF